MGRTSVRRPRSARSASSRPSRRARPTSGCGSSWSTREHSAGGRAADARRMGAAPGHAHGMADDHPDGLLGRAVRPGQGGLGHHGERGGGVRAGRHGRRPRAGCRGAFDVRRRCRDPAAPDRRLVDARQRADLRDRRERRRRPRALPVQLVGQQVPPVRSRRRGPEAHRLSPGDAPLRGADGPGGRVVLRGRRGHAPHHRTVPPASQPEPGHDARADRAHVGRVPGGRHR